MKFHFGLKREAVKTSLIHAAEQRNQSETRISLIPIYNFNLTKLLKL